MRGIYDRQARDVSPPHAIYGRGRRMARRTAIVVASSASANQARKSDVNAPAQSTNDGNAQTQKSGSDQAAQTQTKAPAEPARSAAPATLPLGTVVPSMPSGCTAEAHGGTEYYKCGANHHRTAFQGSDLVYVTAKP